MATSGLKGMNTEQGRTLAKACQNDAETINSITSKLTSQIQGTEWHGTDADSFRSAWETEYSKDLKTVATALEGIYSHLMAEAAQQDQASGN